VARYQVTTFQQFLDQLTTSGGASSNDAPAVDQAEVQGKFNELVRTMHLNVGFIS
jgi:hypothetical protein